MRVRVRVWAARLLAQLLEQPRTVLVRGRDSVRVRDRVRDRDGLGLRLG